MVPFLILVHSTHIYLPMKIEQTECSETSAYKLQKPGNYPKESIQLYSCYSYSHLVKSFVCFSVVNFWNSSRNSRRVFLAYSFFGTHGSSPLCPTLSSPKRLSLANVTMAISRAVCLEGWRKYSWRWNGKNSRKMCNASILEIFSCLQFKYGNNKSICFYVILKYMNWMSDS